jgi:hypothetical protein
MVAYVNDQYGSAYVPAESYPDPAALAAQSRENDRERLIANCKNPEARAQLVLQIEPNRRHQC